MAGLKLSAKAQEEVEYLEHVLKQCDHLLGETEKYAGAKKNVDMYLGPIVRALSQIRQNAMIKNLGPVADAAGTLSIQAQRGSQMQRTRVLREGLNNYKQLIDRVIKATINASLREKAEAARAAGKEPAQ